MLVVGASLRNESSYSVQSCPGRSPAWASAQPGEPPEHLSKVGSMIFVPGRLTDVVTPNPQPLLELSHGYRFLDDLAAGTWDSDIYLISQKPYSSYEAVVDSTSGDIGPTLQVDRIVWASSAVLQSSQAIGVGFSRSLRWRNTTGSDVNTEAVRVRSGQCTTDCGPDDVYFIRGYETTYSVPRFNNSGTQVTVLLLQNPTHYTIGGNIYFWDTTGALIGTGTPFTLNCQAALGVEHFDYRAGRRRVRDHRS